MPWQYNPFAVPDAGPYVGGWYINVFDVHQDIDSRHSEWRTVVERLLPDRPDLSGVDKEWLHDHATGRDAVVGFLGDDLPYVGIVVVNGNLVLNAYILNDVADVKAAVKRFQNQKNYDYW